MTTRRSPVRAFTLLETTVSLVVVGLVMIAAVRTVGATHRMRRVGYDRPRAAMLAHDLLAEILTMEYEEPFETISFGPESSEGGVGRSTFDDVDDFHLWTRTPPEAPDGSALSGLAGWTRTVTVMLGDPNDLTSASGSGDVGVKVITVTVTRGGDELACVTAVRTSSWRVLPE
ncbi:MAG: hypothetical protein HKO59_04705 [Phycisphaerales bacterium]|nr:hypothetical protein [Phycisphaerae bacterium]NNF43174.1 hypothetical protein [Phycisphaerales bacterium]NNM25277.1 hypothetical protein [Phycisphaerales bacterium]